MKPWDKAWEELPECPLKAEAWESMYAYFQGRGGSILQAFEAKCPHPYVTLRVHPKVDPKGSDAAVEETDPKGGPPNPDPDPDPDLSPDPDPKGSAPPAEGETVAVGLADPTEAELFVAYAKGLSDGTGTLSKPARTEANAYALTELWGTVGWPSGQTVAEFLGYLPAKVAEYVADAQRRGQDPRFEGFYSPKRFLDWVRATKAGQDPWPGLATSADGKPRQGGKAANGGGMSSPYGDPTPEDIARMTGRAS